MQNRSLIAFREAPGLPGVVEIPDYANNGRGTKIVHRAGNYQVWHIAPRHHYGGLGRPHLYDEAEYALVLTGESDRAGLMDAYVIKSDKPGHDWHRVRAEYIDHCNLLGSTA